MDKNQRLKNGFYTLTDKYECSIQSEYIEKSLMLLRQEGIFLAVDELKKLLIIRRQTDKLLREEKQEQDIFRKSLF